MPVRWVYLAGTEWIPFDAAAQMVIEKLWDNGIGGGWTAHFGGQVYINLDTELYALINGQRCSLGRTIY
ncbi:hypothetical protein BC938DRAFT_472947 [Jimgerdemannia flammicorona]|uniref:WWE domain-containing protein n=1 Tax=Jimgerdemannia flammicorona TaxID=994334 RepID=A0A433Q531_9FUNG|nr:hypothetical protein BC938DRAFT_472947 [Jimgerdemannia flammicorona]